MSDEKRTDNGDPLPPPEEETDRRETHDLLVSPEMEEKAEAEDVSVEEDLAPEELYKTQEGEGHSYNPKHAWDQGLTYTPPSDPTILPSEESRLGAEVGAGFATSMEDTNPDEERLPPTVDNNDLDLQDDVYIALRSNSETGHLDKIKVQVDDGVVNLLGTVESEDDIAAVESIVIGLDGVEGIRNNLQVKE